MRVLVTGGAGYIGSVTVARLIDAGHEVEAVDDLRAGRREAVPDGVTLHELDIADPRMGDVLASGFDACLHFAASTEAGESMRFPEAFFRNNAAGSLVLLDALIAAGVQRFVLSSTCAVYGQPDRSPVDEATSLRPVSPYGASKLAVEQALGWLGELRELRWAALRYFNAAGADGERGEVHDPETHLIPIVLQVALGQRDHLVIHGDDYATPDGTCIRDYIHVVDLADAHVAALTALETEPRIVANLGTGTGHSVAELVDVARRITGRPIPTITGARRPGDPAGLVAAADHARSVLGWQPTRDLEDMIGDAWDFARRRAIRAR